MPASSDNHAMIGFRSVLFFLVCALLSLVFFIFLPLVFVPLKYGWPVWRFFVSLQLLFLRIICRQSYEIVGRGNLPNETAILACRHEAAWETFVLPVIFDNPAVFLKEEILRYPVAGSIARALGYIGVDRSGSLEKTREVIDDAKSKARDGRSFLIFPNGTRNPAHRFRVQTGVAVLYRALSLPCAPVVLNSGTFWPHKSWQIKPGTITVRVLPPIPAGLRTRDFVDKLTNDLKEPA